MLPIIIINLTEINLLMFEYKPKINFLKQIKHVGLSPLNTQWMKLNKYEVHQTNKSQQCAKFHLNQMKIF